MEPGQAVLLSDELKVTRWAHANEPAPIRTAPTASARTITRLRYLTEDKLPEVYLVLDGVVDAAGDQWLHIRIPMRPNARTGWVPADMLSQLYIVRTRLVIDRTAKRAKLYKNGRKIWEAPVGVGKRGTPTPRGQFWIRERLKGNGGAYGPWAFGTSAYSAISDWPKGGVVGIHGTNQPQLIPGTPVARLRARAQRQDPPARPAHADRHAGQHRSLKLAPPVTPKTICMSAFFERRMVSGVGNERAVCRRASAPRPDRRKGIWSRWVRILRP